MWTYINDAGDIEPNAEWCLMRVNTGPRGHGKQYIITPVLVANKAISISTEVLVDYAESGYRRLLPYDPHAGVLADATWLTGALAELERSQAQHAPPPPYSSVDLGAYDDLSLPDTDGLIVSQMRTVFLPSPPLTPPRDDGRRSPLSPLPDNCAETHELHTCGSDPDIVFPMAFAAVAMPVTRPASPLHGNGVDRPDAGAESGPRASPHCGPWCRAYGCGSWCVHGDDDTRPHGWHTRCDPMMSPGFAVPSRARRHRHARSRPGHAASVLLAAALAGCYACLRRALFAAYLFVAGGRHFTFLEVLIATAAMHIALGPGAESYWPRLVLASCFS